MKALITDRRSLLRLGLGLLYAFAAILAVLTSSASAAVGHTGQALALRASLHPGLVQDTLKKILAAPKAGVPHAAGRYRAPAHAPQYRPRAMDAGSGPVLISEGVQTYDVFAPPPAFQPGDGTLTTSNQFPVRTPDDNYIIFSSNRPYVDPSGNTVSDGTFHLWAISSSGDAPGAQSSLNQLTTSTGNEYYPTLTRDGNHLAFVSQPINGTGNLYVVNGFSPTEALVNVATLTSLTIRTDLNTGFSDVERPTWSPDGQRIAFSAPDTGGANQGVQHIWYLYVNSGGAINNTNGPTADNPPGKLTNGTTNDRDPSWSGVGTDLIAFSRTANTGSNIFVMTGTGATVTQITSGSADTGPAWNYDTRYPGYIAFARGSGTGSVIDYAQAYTIANATLTLNPGAAVTQVNTDNTGNLYTDSYPTWTNVQAAATLNYFSNRTVSYNDPTTGDPSETAISSSLPAGDDDILASLFDDVDPPTLLPYSSGEVVHVTDGVTDTPRRNGDITPGHAVQFTVRLSNRESGVDDNNVYLQIKDPDSKYQDAQGLEHKVFTKDSTDFQNTPDSFGSATTYLYNGGFLNGDAGTAQQKFTVNNNPYYIDLRGAVGGWDGAEAITVGHLTPPGGTNPVTDIPTSGAGQTPLPGGNPANFTSFGQEYECQFVNPQYNASNATDTVPTDYGTPYYLAGVDDQTPHSGRSLPPRPVADGSGSSVTPGQPAEWLQLQKAPQQDSQGGVLYTVTWTTPTSASDYYLDVIAYDKAQTQMAPAATTTQGTPSSGSNWRIYDNIWGFSTQPFNGGNDILVVSDNALGQKFVSSSSTGNIPPIFYGAESYYTDISESLLPNTTYTAVQLTGKTPELNGTPILPDSIPQSQLYPILPTGETGASDTSVLNGLGVDSYPAFGTTTIVGGVSVPVSQAYSLWRILARGAVDPAVLQSYSPVNTSQPAVNDPLTGFTAAAATVPDAHKCVIWVAPYAGDLPLNSAGSIVDPNTQTELRAFVDGGTVGTTTFAGGGRLFVSGGHIAYALTSGGVDTVNNSAGSFLVDILNASLVTDSGGSQNLSAGGGIGSRVSGDGFFNANSAIGQAQDFYTTETTTVFNYATPNASALILGNDYVSLPPGGDPSLWRTDGSLDQLGPVQTYFGNPLSIYSLGSGQIDTITPQNGATTDISIAGPGYAINTNGTGPGLIYKDGIGSNQGRVVYASFGLEGLGIEYYKFTNNNVNTYFARNQRPNVLHNIVTYLRTGSVIGTIKAINTNGAPVNLANATVYLLPNGGTLPASERTTFSAKTTSTGSYRIDGVEPGGYNVVAYETGYTRGISNSPFNVYSDGTTTSSLTSLTLNQTPPGSISGQIVDANGNALAIPGVSLSFTSSDGVSTVTGTTIANGSYTITSVPAGTYSGTAVLANNSYTFTPDPITGVTVTASTNTPNVNFTATLVPGTLGGRLLDDNTNQPIPGATITATAHLSGKVYTVTTDAGSTPAAGPTGDGLQQNYSLTLPELQTGDYYVVSVTTLPANYTNARPAAPQVQIVSGQFTRQDFLATSTLGGVGGLVTDSQTGQPITGATITITDANGNAVSTLTTGAETTPVAGQDGDGQPLNFVTDLPEGQGYQYTVSMPHYTSVSGTFNVVRHIFTRIANSNIALTTTYGTVGGLVTDSYDGTPIKGATVTVSDPNGPNGTTETQTYTTVTPPTTTPNDGVTSDGSPVSYTSDQTTFDAGPNVTVTVSAPNFASVTKTITLTALKFNRVDVALKSTLGTVGGLVIDSQTGKPLGGATVTIAPVDSSGNVGSAVATLTTAADGSTTTPAKGRYGDGSAVNYVATVTAGRYQITVSKQGAGTTTTPDYLTQSVIVTLTPDTFLRQNITLVYAYGNVGGLVTDSYTNQPLPAATITIADASGNVVATLTSRSTPSSPASPSGDGQPLNYSTTQALYQGTYSVTAVAANHTAITKQVTIMGSAFQRQDFSLVSTLGTIGGLVSDSYSGQPVSGATVSVTNAAGTVVANFTTSATVTTPSAPIGDGKAINYTGPLTQGTYTVTVTKRGYGTVATQTATISPNSFTRIDFGGTTTGIPPIHVFPAGYNFFSVPYDYASSGVGFDQIFGTLNTGTRSNPSAGSNRSHIFVWNPQLLQYVLDPQAPADGLHLGQGYWVYLLNPHEVTVAGTAPTSNTVQVALQRGWNMIGVPSTTAVSISALTFLNPATGALLTFDQASTTYHLISSPLYGYNGTSYDTLTGTGSLQPWQSYWIYAYSNVTIQIPTS